MDDFVKTLVKSHQLGNPYPSFTSVDSGATLEKAYNIQCQFVEGINEAIVGYKAALTAEPAQKAMNIDQAITGVLFRDGDYSSRAQIESSRSLLIETELGFRTNQEIRNQISVENVYSFIATVHPMIELASPNLNKPPNGIDLVATNSASFGYMEGAGFECSATEPDSIEVTLSHNGKNLHTGSCASVMSGQKQALVWLVNQIISQRGHLESNSLLMSGAVGQPHPAKQGKYKADFGAMGLMVFSIA